MYVNQYDSILSRTWVFDRCIELVTPPIAVTLIIILSAITSWFLLKIIHKIKSRLRLLIPVLIYVINIFPIFITLDEILVVKKPYTHYFVGYLIIGIIWLLLIFFTDFINKSQKFAIKVLTFVFGTIFLAPLLTFFVVFTGAMVCGKSSVYLSSIDPGHNIHTQIKYRYFGGGEMPKNLEDLRELSPQDFEAWMKTAKVEYVYDSQKNSYTLFVRPSKYHVAIYDNVKDFRIYNLSKFFKFYPAGPYPPDYPGPWDKLPE